MDANLRSYYRKQILLSFFLILPTIPYIYILYRLSLFFLIYHGWLASVLIYPLIWIIFQTIRGTINKIRKSFLSGYKKISPENDLLLTCIYGGDETAYTKLTRLTQVITSQIEIHPNLTYYVYPHGGKSKNGHYYVAVFKEKGGFGLMVSQQILEECSEMTILGVLSHEMSHTITLNWNLVIGAIMGILIILANSLILFIAVSIGFYSWWLFVPALIALGLIHVFIVGLPFKVDEISADHLSAKLGYGWSLIDFMESNSIEFKIPDGIHSNVKSRIARLKKAIYE